MCGIAGIVGRGVDQENGLDTVRSMTASLRHRGPDNEGVLVMEAAVFGHSRLSIIDKSAAGNQPMSDSDGTIMMVCNGEIYNFRELRSELKVKGVCFSSNSDCEVILHGYMVWGASIIGKLKGMFAVAIWDSSARRLLLARDRFGIKPLFYESDGRRLVFGSEIKALMVSGWIEPRLELASLSEYLWYGNTLGSNTMYQGISELAPGHLMTFDESGIDCRPYWLAEEIPEVNAKPGEAVIAVWEALEHAVKSHLVSDVPVGVFLSGGIDSSAITWCATRSSGKKISSYSVGFDFQKGVNELPKARRVAEHCGTDHHELQLNAGDVPDLLESLLNCHDQPFGDAANIPLYLLCRELGDDERVVLQGDGGDEIFAGYRRHGALARNSLAGKISRLVRPFLSFIPSVGKLQGARRFLDALGREDSGMRMALLLTVESLNQRPEALFSDGVRNELMGKNPFSAYFEAANRFKHLDPLQQQLYTDCQIILPKTFLEKVDRATMAFGVEVRVPFLDYDLSEYVMGLPSCLKVRNGQTKWLLRQGLKDKIPQDILDMPKCGFGVPYKEWIRTSLRSISEDLLFSKKSPLFDLLCQQKVRQLFNQHINRQRDNGFILWKLIQLGLWLNKYKVKIG